VEEGGLPTSDYDGVKEAQPIEVFSLASEMCDNDRRFWSTGN